jgi:hypothetical protein
MYRSRFAFALAMAALAAFLFPSPLSAQITFQRTYGGTGDDEGHSVQQTSDGGYIITGPTTSFGAGDEDVYLIKTDAYGDTLWTRTYGGRDYDDGRSVQQTTDGGYIIAGCTNSFGVGDYDVYLVKTDASGDTMWTRTFGGSGYDEGNSVQQTGDGGFIIAGQTWSYGAGENDVYLIRTDAGGNALWTKVYGGAGQDCGYSAQQTADSGFIIAGETQSFGAGLSDIYLIRTNADGDTLWTRTYGDTDIDVAFSVRQARDSGFIITGYTWSCGASYGDVYVVKTNASGDTLWTLTCGGASYDRGYSVLQTMDDGYAVAGYTYSFGAGYGDVYLIKMNPHGETLWTRTYGGTGVDAGWSVQQAADGGYVIAGKTASFGAGGWDVYLIKTDSLGNVAVAEPKTSPTPASALSLSCEPNPFSGTTTIRLSPFAPRLSPLTLRVYDAQGRRVRTFTVNREPCTVWDGTDELGQALPSGTYFVLLGDAGQHASARIVLQR